MMRSYPKRVLALASTFPRWENDTTPPFIYELEKRLSENRENFEISVLAPHHKGAKKNEIWGQLKIHRFQYFWPATLQKLCYDGGILPNIKKNKLLLIESLLLIFFELIAAIRLSKKDKINLLHAHWIIPQGIVALIVHKIFSIPYIITTHGGDIYGLQHPLFKFLKKQILINAKSITVVSTAIREEILVTIAPNLPIEVISMGVDANLFHPEKISPEIRRSFNIDGPFILFVGRLAEKKGVSYLIQAVEKVKDQFPSVKLLIIGEGVEKKKLVSLVNDLKLERNVIFVGAVPNHELPKYYASADIFVAPSIKTRDGDTEGLGLTLVEASLSSCIPVGSDIGGISDVIQHEKTGFLVKEKNAESISQTILTILHNKQKMEEIKKQTRSYSLKKFDWSVVKKAYASVYIS